MWKIVLAEAREIAWLVTVIGGLSIVGVGLAVAVAVG